MKYTIREIEAFSVIGQEVEITNYKKRNIQMKEAGMLAFMQGQN